MQLCLKQLALSMEADQLTHKRFQCPKCRDREHTLSMTRENRSLVLYQCFRMKCGIKGVLRMNAASQEYGNRNTSPQEHGDTTTAQRKKQGPSATVRMTDEDRQCLPVQTLSVEPKWDERRQLVMYPVLSYYGQQLGYVRRYYKELNSWWKGPKAQNVIEDTSQPWAHFPAHQTITDTITVVEDLPSAEAVAPYAPVCALLGTNITNEVLGLFLKLGIRNLNVCLDNDALAKSVQIKRKLALTFSEVNVIFVDKDPKDMTEEELQATFN